VQVEHHFKLFDYTGSDQLNILQQPFVMLMPASLLAIVSGGGVVYSG